MYIDTATSSVISTAYTALSRLADSVETTVYLMRTAARRPDAPRNTGFQAVFAQALAMRGHVSEAWKTALASRSPAASEIAALGLVNADSADAAMQPWLRGRNSTPVLALPAFAMAHDTATLKRMAITVDSELSNPPAQQSKTQRARIVYAGQAIRAYYQLARGDSAAAAKEFIQLSDSMVHFPVDQFIRARLIARTDPRRAFLMMTGKQLGGDIISVARELEIGRLGEKLGDTPRAVDAYAYVASAWQNADNEQLKNAVKESRDALKRLDSDGRVRAQLANVRYPAFDRDDDTWIVKYWPRNACWRRTFAEARGRSSWKPRAVVGSRSSAAPDKACCRSSPRSSSRRSRRPSVFGCRRGVSSTSRRASNR
jgi:hypothetical protein